MSIKNHREILLTEPEEIHERWIKYVESLYDKNRKPTDKDVTLEEEESVNEDEKGSVKFDSENWTVKFEQLLEKSKTKSRKGWMEYRQSF